MNIDGATKIAGIFGYPIEHTASPCIHNAAFEALKLNWVYLPFEVSPNNLELAVKAIIVLNIQGLSITIPHKRAIIPFLNELSPESEFIGAVNAITRKEDKLIGHNTDGEGFLRSLEENNISPVGKNIFILGAGGASYAVIYQLLLKGAKKITIANRTTQKAEVLRKHFSPKGNIEIFPLENACLKSAFKEAKILINTTSVGMRENDPLIINEDCLNTSLEAVVDIIYSPPETKLLKMAKEKGIKTINGIGMLLHQGALSFQLWTGKKAPVEVMRKALYEKFKK